MDANESEIFPKPPPRRKKDFNTNDTILPMILIQDPTNTGEESNVKTVDDTFDLRKFDFNSQKIRNTKNLRLPETKGILNGERRTQSLKVPARPKWVSKKFRKASTRQIIFRTASACPNCHHDPFDILIDPTLYNGNIEKIEESIGDVVFKQFESFKDFTRQTAVCGLTAGENTAFWFFNELKYLSKKWFTHTSLLLILILYSMIGAAIFMLLEGK